MPGLSLASVVTSNPERAEQAQSAHPGVEVLPDADALFASAGSHDLVVVAAPNREHVPLGLAAVEAGLHLVVDKPLAANVADAQRLADAAEARGVVASVFHNRRWDGDFMTLRRLVSEGSLGELSCGWSRASIAGGRRSTGTGGARDRGPRTRAGSCSTSART